MIKLLEEIDELLAFLEDTAHGEEGKRITEMRYKILTEIDFLTQEQRTECSCPDDQCQLGDHPTCKWKEYFKLVNEIEQSHKHGVVMEWCNDYFSEFNLDNHPYMLKKKINPPQVRWVAIDEQKPGYDGTLFVFGLINKGSQHEVFSTFFAVYDKESDKFFDFHGDTICETVTHWMNVE